MAPPNLGIPSCNLVLNVTFCYSFKMSFHTSGHLLTSVPTFKWEAGKFKIIRIIYSNLNICENWTLFWFESELIIFSIRMTCNHIQTKYCALRNYFWELVVLIHYILPFQNMLNYPVILIAPKWPLHLAKILSNS